VWGVVNLNKTSGLGSDFNLISRVHVDSPGAVEALAEELWNFLYPRIHPVSAPLQIVCIGTDRSTGDCLGPLVGSKLSSLGTFPPSVGLFGTLDEPVHAANLDEYMKLLQEDKGSSFVLAIDACLGRSENIGYISIKDGPLKPGTGVNKKLTEVGSAHLVGVVNVGGFMEYFVLQNTRLSLVMRMADVIAGSIAAVLGWYWECFHPNLCMDGRNQQPLPQLHTDGWAADHAAPSSGE
jgi:putative sporulation protein YyaC